ncbi:MAG: hypothetical protein AB2556_21220 [Candidatus Thiodiazotropha sp.]
MRSHGTQSLACSGIDRVFYQNAYPVSAVAYGLYPIRDPDLANLGPLRDGRLNCVAQRVVGALRGQGLTRTRRRKIQEWEERGWATRKGVDELEQVLKKSIVLRDIAGEDIFNSGKYQSRGANIELIYHNGHAWPKDLHFPQSREVHIHEGDVWQAIRVVTRGEPIAAWLLGGQDRQLSVDQFVLQDGRTYRTQGFHERLQAICAKLGNPELAERTTRPALWQRKRTAGNQPQPASSLASMEHGHGGLWNSRGCDTREVVSIDMKACYPASFQGMGEAKPYFERIGHPTHRMVRVAINGALPEIGTGFAEIQEWDFDATCHPVIPALFGRHFADGGWAPTQLLAYLTESGLLKSLKVREAIISLKTQSMDQACSVIGKFIQGSKAYGKRLTRRLVTD